jgi:hypothetical protein
MPDYKLISFNQLHKADIIFTTQRDSVISATIRAATKSIISHTMLVTGFNQIIDSTDIGVKERGWNRASEGVTLAIAMRRHSLLNAADQDKVVAAAKAFEDRPYDKLGAAGSGMFGSSRNQKLTGAGCSLNIIACAFLLKEIADNAKDENADKKFFCSELVSRAFTEAGFPIVEGKATTMTPQMVLTSTNLTYVGHLINKPKPVSNLTKEEYERNRRSGYRKDY